MVLFVRTSVGEFLWALHSNFSSIFTSFRDIAGFVLQHGIVFAPDVSLEVGGWPSGYVT